LFPDYLTVEYWENVSDTAKDFVRTCLTIDPTKRPTAEEMLKHKWLADTEPHYVEDKEGNMTNLLPHIQKAFDARKTCKSLGFICPYVDSLIGHDSPQGGLLDDGDEAHVHVGFTVVPTGPASWRQHCSIQGRVRKGASK
jgi:serine/threonine protein kinase